MHNEEVSSVRKKGASQVFKAMFHLDLQRQRLEVLSDLEAKPASWAQAPGIQFLHSSAFDRLASCF